MSVLIVTGAAIVVAWCLCAFVVAGAVGRAFARASDAEAPPAVPRQRQEASVTAG